LALIGAFGAKNDSGMVWMMQVKNMGGAFHLLKNIV
jgi:hypothetical protein